MPHCNLTFIFLPLWAERSMESAKDCVFPGKSDFGVDFRRNPIPFLSLYPPPVFLGGATVSQRASLIKPYTKRAPRLAAASGNSNSMRSNERGNCKLFENMQIRSLNNSHELSHMKVEKKSLAAVYILSPSKPCCTSSCRSLSSSDFSLSALYVSTFHFYSIT